MVLIHFLFMINDKKGGIILHVVKNPTTSGGFMKVRVHNHKIIILVKGSDDWVRVTDKWILDRMYRILMHLQAIRHIDNGKK